MQQQGVKRPGETPTGNPVPQAKKQKVVLPDFSFSQDLKGHLACVSAVKYSPDGKWLASCSSDKTVRIWDAETGALEKTLEGHTGGINDLAWTTDCSHVASASDDNTINLWEVSSGKLSKTFSGHTDHVFCVKFNKTSNILYSGSFDKSIRVWDVNSGKCTKVILGHVEPVTSLDVGKDGGVIASSSYSGKICIWDGRTGTSLGSFDDGTSKAVGNVMFSPNTKYLLTGTLGNRVNLWDVSAVVERTANKKPKLLKSYKGHKNEDYCIFSQFFADKWIISASEDNTIKVWSLLHPDSSKTLTTTHTGPIMGVYVRPDKKGMVSFAMDGTIKTWILEAQPSAP
eukprot:TRINITY_DN5409_c0_g1_i1.p1 TRINITY_DN5409_c0_g1~~TRINITY_DN5409_c0_g1_i1.p1  ORF type:complete len:342 (+),score=59.71 TRINITY_DN5409_c0_g1_i1:27-1052(+)